MLKIHVKRRVIIGNVTNMKMLQKEKIEYVNWVNLGLSHEMIFIGIVLKGIFEE